ncbi:MAG: hydroxymethylbilane synthase [Roseimicrobium sp.]
MKSHLVLGTRGSELALRQAEMVEAALRAAHPGIHVEQKIITTIGDKRTDLRFSEFSTTAHVDKGIFTKELEVALEAKQIDLAVHSLKDVPSELAPTFCIAAVLPRAHTEDVLITREAFSLESLPPGAKVGTSSVRRLRQLQWRRPDLVGVEIRGNVPTRVRKVFAPSELDGLLLARAGLERLGLLDEGVVTLDGLRLPACILACDSFPPAAGQGAIGLETRSEDAATQQLLQAINHPPTLVSVQAEREFLRLLGAGCQTPVGAQTRIDGATLHMRVLVFDESNLTAAPVDAAASASAHEPLALAAKLAAMVRGH